MEHPVVLACCEKVFKQMLSSKMQSLMIAVFETLLSFMVYFIYAE